MSTKPYNALVEYRYRLDDYGGAQPPVVAALGLWSGLHAPQRRRTRSLTTPEHTGPVSWIGPSAFPGARTQVLDHRLGKGLYGGTPGASRYVLQPG